MNLSCPQEAVRVSPECSECPLLRDGGPQLQPGRFSHLVLPVLFQVTIVEKADSSSVLPSPLSISTRNRMTFLFANLKDRDFLVQRISDFLQQTTSRIYSDRELAGSYNSSDDEVCAEHRKL